MNKRKDDSYLKQVYVTQTQGYVDVFQKRDIWKQVEAKYNGKLTISRTVDRVYKNLKLQIPYNNQIIIVSESDTRPLKI